jgi:hypothetical protein
MSRRAPGSQVDKTFVVDIHGFVAARGLELVHFAKGQRKDELTISSRRRLRVLSGTRHMVWWEPAGRREHGGLNGRLAGI